MTIVMGGNPHHNTPRRSSDLAWWLFHGGQRTILRLLPNVVTPCRGDASKTLSVLPIGGVPFSRQIRVNDVDQFLGRLGSIGSAVFWVDQMLPDMVFDDIGNKAIQGTPASGRLLKKRRAFGIFR